MNSLASEKGYSENNLMNIVKTASHWRIILLFLLILLISVTANLFQPTTKQVPFDIEAAFPKSFGQWRENTQIKLISPSPDVQANLDNIYDKIISRSYINDAGITMMLVVAYGGDQSDGLKAHRQEVCYQAQGFTIKKVSATQLTIHRQAVPAYQLETTKGQRYEPVTYWFTMGDKVVMGRLARLLTQIQYGLRGEIPDGMLVRVSSLGTDTTQQYAQQAIFLNELASHIPEKLRYRVIGQINH